jgi:hypothetical protein
MLRRTIAALMTLSLVLSIVSVMHCFASSQTKAGQHVCCEPSAKVAVADCCGSFAPRPAMASDAAPGAAFFLQAATYSSIHLATQDTVVAEVPSNSQPSRRLPATIIRT